MSDPIVPWIGGKRRLADRILPLFPPHHAYIEPFCGAAALFFAKPPSRVEVLNDINGDIINLYRVVSCHLEEFVRQFKFSLHSREMFEWARETPPETLTDIQRAARFFYLQKTCFGGKPTGRTFGVDSGSPPKLNLLRIEEDLSVAHLRLARVTVERLEWHECIRRYDQPGALFYLDPPYWQTEGYGTPFPFQEYRRLAETMATIKGKAILSIGDNPDIRPLFKPFFLEEFPFRHTIGGGPGVQRMELVYRTFEKPGGRLF